MITAGAVYVYYQVPQDNLAAVRRAVMALLSVVKTNTGVQGRLARRRDDAATWMEIYESVADPEGFERILHEAAESHGLDALLAPSRRHTEVFIADVLDPAAAQSNTGCA